MMGCREKERNLIVPEVASVHPCQDRRLPSIPLRNAPPSSYSDLLELDDNPPMKPSACAGRSADVLTVNMTTTLGKFSSSA